MGWPPLQGVEASTRRLVLDEKLGLDAPTKTVGADRVAPAARARLTGIAARATDDGV